MADSQGCIYGRALDFMPHTNQNIEERDHVSEAKATPVELWMDKGYFIYLFFTWLLSLIQQLHPLLPCKNNRLLSRLHCDVSTGLLFSMTALQKKY